MTPFVIAAVGLLVLSRHQVMSPVPRGGLVRATLERGEPGPAPGRGLSRPQLIRRA